MHDVIRYALSHKHIYAQRHVMQKFEFRSPDHDTTGERGLRPRKGLGREDINDNRMNQSIIYISRRGQHLPRVT
jgi:hypothetical protein